MPTFKKVNYFFYHGCRNTIIVKNISIERTVTN